jgi:excisionase family DNA binding protein
MIQNDNENEVLTLQELAEDLKISYTKAYNLLNEGEIKGFKIGSIWRISRKAINEYINRMSGFKR